MIFRVGERVSLKPSDNEPSMPGVIVECRVDSVGYRRYDVLIDSDSQSEEDRMWQGWTADELTHADVPTALTRPYLEAWLDA